MTIKIKNEIKSRAFEQIKEQKRVWQYISNERFLHWICKQQNPALCYLPDISGKWKNFKVNRVKICQTNIKQEKV